MRHMLDDQIWHMANPSADMPSGELYKYYHI